MTSIMRFRDSSSPPPYLNRRDQFRLLGLVALFAFVLIAMKIAARPSSWYWLTGKPNDVAETAGNQEAPSSGTIDYGVRVDEANGTLAPGAFRSPLQPVAKETLETSPVGDQVPGNDVLAPDRADRKDTATSELPILAPDLLAAVQDNTLGIRRAEKDAHDTLLAIARDVPTDVLERSAKRDINFTVLMLESEQFRGKLLSVDGDLRRLVEFPAAENTHGFTNLYEAWIFTRESGNNPYRVVCTSVPEDLPQGLTIQPPVRVRVTGYFFKRYSYATADGRVHAAPLILAKSPRRLLAKPKATHDVNLPPYIVGILVAFGLVIGISLWRFRVSDRGFRRQHLNRFTEASPESIASLADLPTSAPAEQLRQLAESVPHDIEGKSNESMG